MNPANVSLNVIPIAVIIETKNCNSNFTSINNNFFLVRFGVSYVI